MKVNSLTIKANKYVDITSVGANVVLVKAMPSTVTGISSETHKKMVIDETLTSKFAEISLKM